MRYFIDKKEISKDEAEKQKKINEEIRKIAMIDNWDAFLEAAKDYRIIIEIN